jgi:hypothetical protein
MRVAAICMAFALGPASADALAQGANNVMEKIRACSLLAPVEELECLEKLSREIPLPRPSAAPVPEVASPPPRPTASSAPKAAASEAARADALARDLDTAQRKIEALTAAAKAAASEAAQAKEIAERSATAEKALPGERARADALARDLDAAQRKIEALTAAAKKAASGETARLREEAMRAAEELQQSQQQTRARTDALERDLAAARRELEAKVNASGKSAEEATRLQQTAERAAAELRLELQEERYKAEKLARELAAAWRELEMQATRLAKAGDNTAQKQALTELRQALQQAESAAAADKESLAQERTRNQELAQELAARRDTTMGPARTTTASPSDTPGPAPGMASEATTASLAKVDKAPMPAGAKPATMAPRPPGPEASGNPEAARLMARASLLLRQGDIGAARIVLERAAETGSASALFSLAETYDPVVLSAWGTVGTQGDVAKARDLYSRASAGGVHEAKDRLNALP